MVQHCETLNRSVQVVNLDPAAEHFNYDVMAGKEVPLLKLGLTWDQQIQWA